MTTDPDQLQVPADRPSLAPSVAGDLEAIFADAALGGAGRRTSASKVRTVGGRRSRWPMATVGAVAAAGFVGLSAGAGLVGLHSPSKASRAAATSAPAPAAPRAMLPVQVAVVSPTVSVPEANGPVPVLDTEPVADTPSARAPGQARMHMAAHRRPARAGDLLAADRRLRVAYSHAVHAGVPRHILVDYRNRWADLREDASWRPARVAAGYGQMSDDLERLARRPGTRHAAGRFSLFDFFS